MYLSRNLAWKVACIFDECGLHPINVALHFALCPTSRGSASLRLSNTASNWRHSAPHGDGLATAAMTMAITARAAAEMADAAPEAVAGAWLKDPV